MLDAVWKAWRAPGRAREGTRMPGLEMLVDEPLEFVDGDQVLAPGRLHGVERRHDAAVDRRDADAEGLRGLLAAVGQARDGWRAPEFSGVDGRRPFWGRRMCSGSLASALASRTHGSSYTNR